MAEQKLRWRSQGQADCVRRHGWNGWRTAVSGQLNEALFLGIDVDPARIERRVLLVTAIAWRWGSMKRSISLMTRANRSGGVSRAGR